MAYELKRHYKVILSTGVFILRIDKKISEDSSFSPKCIELV